MTALDGERVVRDGALTAESLRDAISDEKARGHAVGLLAVGSEALWQVAARIVLSPDSALSELRVTMPLVVVDERLGEHGWELRPE